MKEIDEDLFRDKELRDWEDKQFEENADDES
jgi:hypothetical protein